MPIAPALRTLVFALMPLVPLVATAVGQDPPPSTAARGRAVGTMAELMSKIIYPTSDAVFYIETRTPKTDAEWDELQGKTLMLSESANLLLMPGRARDQERWIADTKLMLDAAADAFKAARRHDVAGLVAVNDALYQSCVTCHRHYRPNYGRGRM
ncbi:MAG TPA: hypothetical protein VH583_08645 [Vicinamibacterales bacterium]|jgi:hypothetical protein